MKHLLKVTAVLLAVTCATAQTPKPATQTARPATVNTAQKPPVVKPVVRTPQGLFPFEVVSTKRIDSVESRNFGNHIAFTNPQLGGVLVVLKSKSPDGLVYFSTDFSLGWGKDKDPADIPRRPCMGISDDISKTPEHDWDWTLGGVGRNWTTSDEPYFAVVFGVPKNVSEFTLYYAQPVGTKIKLAK